MKIILLKNNDSVTTAISKLDSKVNTGWTVSDGNTETDDFAVKPGETLKFNGDDNIDVEAKDYEVNVSLKDNIVLGEDENQININGAPKEGEALLSVGNGKFIIGQQGDITATVEDTSFNFGSDGVAVNSKNGSTFIDGQSVRVGSVGGTGGIVINGNGSGTITGLTNTTLNVDGFAESKRAATEEQLQAAMQDINKGSYKGWTVSTNGKADNEVAVGSNENVDFSNTDGNIVVGQKDTNLTFDLNPVVTLDGNESDNNKVVLDGNNGTINVTNTVKKGQGQGPGKTITNEFNFDNEGATFTNTTKKGPHDPVKSSTTINGGTITTDTVKGLDNTTIDYEGFAKEGKAATEEQLKDVYDGSVKYWKKQDGTYDKSFIQLEGGEEGTTITHLKDGAVAEHSTEAINGSQLWETQQQIKDVETTASKHTIVSTTEDSNLTVKNVAEKGEADNYQVTLNDDIILGDYFNNGDGVLISGKSGTISATNSITVGEDQGLVIDGQKKTVQGLSNTTWTGTTETPNRAATEGQLQSAYDGSVKYWKKQDGTYDKSFIQLEGGEKGTTITHLKDGVVAEYSTEAINGSQLWETQQQIKDVETTANKHTIVSTTTDSNLTVENVAEEGEAANYQVALKDNINLNDRVYINGAPKDTNTIIDIKSNDKSNSIFTVEDKGKGSISIGGIDITNVDGPYLAVGDGKLKFYKDGGLSTGNTTSTFSVRPDGDLEISGKNSSFDVDAETGNINAENNSGSSIKMDGNGTTISVNDGTVMGNNTTMTVNKDGVAFSAYGNGTTVINGQTISAGGVVINNNGSGTINGLTNHDWDGTNYVSGQAATEDQLLKVQQAVDDVASKHTTVSGDENITVNHSDGSQDYQVTLNDNITLGDKEDKKTSTSLTLYTDPTPIKDGNGNDILNEKGEKVTGYVPKAYISNQGRVDDFISTHGGFMMYATDTSGQGVFGITTDGMVHAKDVISYMPDPNSDDKVLKYSLNDVGDIVTQIAHDTYKVNGKEYTYTLISDFVNEDDKENPFQSVEGERTIGLAVRDDGAVVVGAIVDEEGVESGETGIRINDATSTGGGKDTITGLSNTDWRPAAIRDSISTFGTENDDDSKAKIEASKAATQGQLDAMYDTVVGYDINESKTGIDYSTITLKGKQYASTEDSNGLHEGGTLITNLAYSNGNGSDAVNVDYLNDAIEGVKTEASGSDRYLSAGAYDQETGNITLTVANSQDVVIDGIASKVDISNLNNQITDINNQITDIKNQIGGTGTGGNNNTDITGGHVDKETGNIVLEKDDGSKVEVGQLTDSVVDSAEFKDGTLTITSKDKYSKEEISSVKVEGIASTEVVGATTKEDLATAYKDADKDGNATTEYITDSESMVEADVALDHAIQDVAGTSYANDMVLSNRIDSVEKRLGDVEQRIDKVGAMAAAIANLRTMGFDPEAPTEIAVGVGQYKSETGLAIGVFHYPNQDFMLSASLSTSGDEVMGGIGATWRIGRKTAAEKAKDEEKRILAKAEEIKQAAKRAEVKAQADRHAKLLAEREAKGESIRPIENKVEQTQEQA